MDDQRPVSELSDKELEAMLRKRWLMFNREAPPSDIADAINAEARLKKAARAEIERRRSGGDRGT